MTLNEYVSEYPRRAPVVKLIMRRLEQSDADSRQVCAALNMSWSQTRKAIKALHESKLVHICRWRRANNRASTTWMPIWSAGKGQDLPRPKGDPLGVDRAYQKRKRAKIKNGSIGGDLLSLVYSAKPERGVGES